MLTLVVQIVDVVIWIWHFASLTEILTKHNFCMPTRIEAMFASLESLQWALQSSYGFNVIEGNFFRPLGIHLDYSSPLKDFWLSKNNTTILICIINVSNMPHSLLLHLCTSEREVMKLTPISIWKFVATNTCLTCKTRQYHTFQDFIEHSWSCLQQKP